MRNLRNAKGFSLLESCVAIAIMGVVLYFVYQMPGWFAKNESAIAKVVTKDRLFKGFSLGFIQVAEQADVAMRFENLAIPTACSNDRPCVRELTAEGTFQPAPRSALPESIQFFREEAGPLEDRAVGREGEPLRVVGRKSLVLEGSVLSGEYYATWPLIDQTSAPFVLMKRGQVPEHFFVYPNFATGKVDGNRGVLLRGTRKGIAVDQIVGRPVLAYNVNDLAQHTVQKVREAKDCSIPANRSACVELARQYMPGGTPELDPATGPVWDGRTLDDAPAYLLDLDSFSEAELRSARVMPEAQISGPGWHDQAESFFIFPTEVASIYEATGGSGLLQKPIDVKRFDHYVHSMGKGQVAVLPFDIVSYELVPAAPGGNGPSTGELDPNGKKVLVQRTLGSSKVSVALADIGKEGLIYFGRKLGTSGLAVFEMK